MVESRSVNEPLIMLTDNIHIRFQSSGYQSTNGTGVSTSRPTSPGSTTDGVQIVITGRTRSRTDLCPDVPRSKFEHSV